MYAEHPHGKSELYDMIADPFQLKRMHVGGPHETPESAEIERRLEQRVRQLKRCAGATCRQ